MTAAKAQDSTVEHLDFPIPCDEDGCERPAAFVNQCRFCRYSGVICGPHLTDFLARDQYVPAWACDECDHRELDLLALIAVSLLRP
jgi:hypothetical protein